VIVDVKIREAEMSDAAALADLMTQLDYPTNENEMRQRLERVFSNSSFKTFVAVANDRICGMIGTVSQASYEHDDLGGRILALVVGSDVRGKGVGKKLIAAAENDFARRNIRRIGVLTHLRRKEAHKFYESNGYERTGYRYAKILGAPTN
jgi:ribosomal protein S18 acetylase RimI-like enzyme